jgi:putative membrane protein
MTADPLKRRLHPAGVLVMVAARARELVILVVLAVVNRGETDLLGNWFYFAGIPIVVLLGIVRWYRFRYWIEGDQFRVEDGALIRKRAYIPLDKVQTVDLTAGILQRMLGLVKLQIKTGAAGTQADLTAITREEADRLRSLLRPNVASVDALDAAPSTIGDRGGATVYRLTAKELLLAGATSGQLAVVAAMVSWVFSQASDTIIDTVVRSIESLAVGDSVVTTSPLVIAALIAGGLIVSWAGATIWAVARYGRFSVSRQGPNIIVRRGLLEQQEITLPAERIQAVRYHETLLRQPLGYGALYVETVGHTEAKSRASYLHPFVRRDAYRALIADLLPQFDVVVAYTRPPKRALPRFFIKPTVIVSLIVGASMLLSPWAALGFFTLPVIWLFAYLGWRDTGVSLGENVAVVRSRGLRRTTAYLQRHTAQVAQTTASLLQRRRDVASVHMTVATGVTGRTFVARDLDSGDAWRTMRWVLEGTRGREV